MARWPEAIWQPVAQVGGALRPQAVCLHHQAGSGNPAPVYASRGVSAHFWLPRSGMPVQHVDTDRQAWHGVAHNAYSIGVETEGCGAPPHAEPLTEHQLNSFAELMRWANRAHGIPLVLSEVVSQPGLNYHRCQGGPATGCPCDVRKNARAEILRRAGGGGRPPIPEPVPQEEPTMKVVRHSSGRLFITDGVVKRHINEPTTEWPDLLKLCGQTKEMTLSDYTIDRMPEIISVGEPDSVRVDLENINRAANR